MHRLLAIVAIAVVVAGCGGAAAPTAVPSTATPEAVATAIPTLEPTAVATPTATPEVTPMPTPRVTPRPVTSIIEAEHPAIKASALRKAVEQVIPRMGDDPFAPNALTAVDMCTDADERMAERTVGCEILIRNLYRFYARTNDADFYNAALDAYNYAYRNLGELQMDSLNEYIQK